MANPKPNRPTISGLPNLARHTSTPHWQAAYETLPASDHRKFCRRDNRGDAPRIDRCSCCRHPARETAARACSPGGAMPLLPKVDLAAADAAAAEAVLSGRRQEDLHL